AAALWIRGNRTPPRQEAGPRASDQQSAERFPRNRLLERATLGLGGLVALGVALPVAGFAVLPAFLGQRRRAVNLGPIGAFPQGQFVIATFLSDPSQGEISRRAAYVRTNGLLGGAPSFTLLSSPCTHVHSPPAAASRARVRSPGPTAPAASATVSPPPGRSRSSTRSTPSHERLRARHQLGGDGR